MAETRLAAEGRAVLVSGANRGIGRAIAERLHADGYALSLGARDTGDLAPLAHLASVLIGEGQAELDGQRLPGGEALRRAGLEPVRWAGGLDGRPLGLDSHRLVVIGERPEASGSDERNLEE